jgi:hypothetical protein
MRWDMVYTQGHTADGTIMSLFGKKIRYCIYLTE